MMEHGKLFRAVRCVLIITVACAIGILLGRMMTDYEMRYFMTRQFCGSYRGIDVYKCGELNNDNFLGHIYMLEKAPDVLAESCEALYFTGESLSLPEVGQNGAALGLTQDATIYITTNSFYPDVLYHELFHAYDNTNGKISDSEKFRKIFDKERETVSETGGENGSRTAEFFAAAGAEYLLMPDTLRKKAPETYAFIDELIDAYGEVYQW